MSIFLLVSMPVALLLLNITFQATTWVPQSSYVYAMKTTRSTLLLQAVAVASLSGSLTAQILSVGATRGQDLVSPVSSSSLPPIPPGRATVIGGKIHNVDAVRDQFTLKVFGGKSMKILFDERSQFYRDGVRTSVLDLHANDHASIETTLDGTKVFALRIHIADNAPEGEIQGKVSSYNSQTGELAVRQALSKDPITVHVPAGLQVMLIGQQAASVKQDGSIDLVPGSMVDVRFKAINGGHGVATGINVVAVPGSTFTFRGTLSSLDVQAGRLVILDPKDGQSREVIYDPSKFPIGRTLQQGAYVKVMTSFDGSQYAATEITIE